MVNKSLDAHVTLLDKIEGPLNIARWLVTCARWDHNLVLTGVYRSPSDKTTLTVEAQFTAIAKFMSLPPQSINKKYDVCLMTGDFNAKI